MSLRFATVTFLVMFSDILLDWFDVNKRDLPWRGETDPYKIWISEIILQQTRVVQGIDYYYRFVAMFPTVTALAEAEEAQVLKVWQGLGYYSRARNLHAAAQSIVRDFNGKFPSNYQDIRNLKGVGNYTAAAVASIAFNLPYPAVDGNVLRFVARYQGIFDNIATDATRRRMEEICARWIPAERAGTFNQAMMEMGATLCTPKSPDCTHCPFSRNCYAFQHEQVLQLPVKEQVIKVVNRYFHYLIFLKNNQTLLQRREQNDIWKNLFEFPLVETSSEKFDVNSYLQTNKVQVCATPQLAWQTKHVLTHRHIFAYFYVIPVADFPTLNPHQVVVDCDKMGEYAVAKVTERAMKEVGL